MMGIDPMAGKTSAAISTRTRSLRPRFLERIRATATLIPTAQITTMTSSAGERLNMSLRAPGPHNAWAVYRHALLIIVSACEAPSAAYTPVSDTGSFSVSDPTICLNIDCPSGDKLVVRGTTRPVGQNSSVTSDVRIVDSGPSSGYTELRRVFSGNKKLRRTLQLVQCDSHY